MPHCRSVCQSHPGSSIPSAHGRHGVIAVDLIEVFCTRHRLGQRQCSYSLGPHLHVFPVSVQQAIHQPPSNTSAGPRTPPVSPGQPLNHKLLTLYCDQHSPAKEKWRTRHTTVPDAHALRLNHKGLLSRVLHSIPLHVMWIWMCQRHVVQSAIMDLMDLAVAWGYPVRHVSLDIGNAPVLRLRDRPFPFLARVFLSLCSKRSISLSE